MYFRSSGYMAGFSGLMGYISSPSGESVCVCARERASERERERERESVRERERMWYIKIALNSSHHVIQLKAIRYFINHNIKTG